MKKFILYLIRWQMSTPILAVVVAYFAYLGEWAAAGIANLVGGCIFFWVDRWIFKPKQEGKPYIDTSAEPVAIEPEVELEPEPEPVKGLI